MTRVLLTGGSGFIATHILDVLLDRGQVHSVGTTVRSQDKADKIREAHPGFSKDKLDFSIVGDIAVEVAFDEAVKSDPPFEAVIHTASPFHFNVTDIQKQLLDPAVIGPTGILKSIKKSASKVQRIAITSPFASILDPFKGNWPEHIYSEADWNPMTREQALMNPALGYTALQHWPFVFGPIMHDLKSLDALNTSNTLISGFVLGKCKESIPPNTAFIWIDVRDLALGHVLAMEKPEAGSKRFLFTAGHFTNKEMVEIIRKNFPEYNNRLLGLLDQGGDYPTEGVYKVDNSQTRQVLGIDFTPLEKAIVDMSTR